MPWPHLLIAGFNFKDVLPYCGVPVASGLTYLGVRYSQTAPLQQSVNDALRLFLDESQAQHARDSAHISVLESENKSLTGELRQARQRYQSLVRQLHEAGVEIPLTEEA